MAVYEVVFANEEAGGARSSRVFDSIEQAIAFIEGLSYPFQGYLLHELNVYDTDLGREPAMEVEEEMPVALHGAY